MDNLIIVVILLVIVGLAAGYVIHAKKKGKRCIGCPEGCCSNGSCPGCNGTKP